MIKLLTSLFILFTFISCGKAIDQLRLDSVKVQKVDPVDEEMFSYELRDSGCTTGIQKFAKHEQACLGLKDDNLNQQCAQEERRDLFLSESCSGLFDS